MHLMLRYFSLALDATLFDLLLRLMLRYLIFDCGRHQPVDDTQRSDARFSITSFLSLTA